MMNYKTRINSLIILLLSILLFIKCEKDPSTIYIENFNGPNIPQDLFVEGSEKVAIRNGRLWVDASADSIGESNVSTIWLNKEFSRDLKVEFDASIIQSPGDKNNINFFFLYSDTTGKSLKASSHLRKDGGYKSYHKLNGYIFTYLANGNPDTARFRFRDCPGFNLVSEANGYHCLKDSIYHIEITKRGNRITYAVDGKVFIDYKNSFPNPIHSKGILGFRTWRTELWWDNLKVTQL